MNYLLIVLFVFVTLLFFGIKIFSPKREIENEEEKTIIFPLYAKTEEAFKQVGFCSLVNRVGEKVVLSMSENLDKYNELYVKSLLFKKGVANNEACGYLEDIDLAAKNKIIKKQRERMSNKLIDSSGYTLLKKEDEDVSVDYLISVGDEKLYSGNVRFNEIMFNIRKYNISIEDLRNITCFELSKNDFIKGEYDYIKLKEKKKIEIELLLGVDVVDYDGIYISDYAKKVGL